VIGNGVRAGCLGRLIPLFIKELTVLPSGHATTTITTTTATTTATNYNDVSECLKKGHNPSHKDALALRKIRFHFKLTEKLELPF